MEPPTGCPVSPWYLIITPLEVYSKLEVDAKPGFNSKPKVNSHFLSRGRKTRQDGASYRMSRQHGASFLPQRFLRSDLESRGHFQRPVPCESDQTGWSLQQDVQTTWYLNPPRKVLLVRPRHLESRGHFQLPGLLRPDRMEPSPGYPDNMVPHPTPSKVFEVTPLHTWRPGAPR